MEIAAELAYATDRCASLKELCGGMGTAGKPKATFCDAGGGLCSSDKECSADTDCPAVGEMATKMPCCADYKTVAKARAAALCDGVTDADIDKMVRLGLATPRVWPQPGGHARSHACQCRRDSRLISVSTFHNCVCWTVAG